MPGQGDHDPIARMTARLEARALSLRPLATDVRLPKDLRAALRETLRDVFRTVATAPAAQGDRRSWMTTAREALGKLDALGKKATLAIRPRPGLYEGDRLGVIRVHRVVRLSAGPAAAWSERHDPQRFVMLERFVRRLNWLWKRIDGASGETAAEPATVADRQRRQADEYARLEGYEHELLWGRARR